MLNKTLTKPFSAIILCLFILLGCTKTYEDGPVISLRSKKNRITGKWKLVNVEGVDLIEPNAEAFIELTDEKVDEKHGVEFFKAKFINFQLPYAYPVGPWDHSQGANIVTQVDSVFNEVGFWHFGSGSFPICEGEELREEEVDEKEGIGMGIGNGGGEFYKILRLTNKEFVLYIPQSCYYNGSLQHLYIAKEQKWYFEKVK